MKTSLNWLSFYVDVPEDPTELTEQLTLAGLEVEGIEYLGRIPGGVVVGEIRTRETHPNADRLSVCAVDVGEEEPLQIVCGAPNCDAGARVPVATIGTALAPDFTVRKAKLRGVESRGMMCSADELGLGGDHSGLLILPEDAPLGAPAEDWIDSDVVVDWEVTPNRPDWLSHIGIARELAAVFDMTDAFELPEVPEPPTVGTAASDLASVEVLDPELCPRYTARVLRNVKVAPSPEWMQTLLRAVGLRPINNVVDITNFVLMECGQPLHAFDYDRLAGGRIVVRRAEPGEKLTTLDEQTHELTAENLVIADAERGVALAGVMGGANSEISDGTTTVLLESAQFAPSNIRATSRGLGLMSDSSHRFERGVGFDMVEFASRRAAALLCEFADGELLDGVVDVCAGPYQPHEVSCRVARVNQLLGTALNVDDMVDCLRQLQLPISYADGERITVSVPSFRLDLEREADLVEEIARIHGLANIAATPVSATVGGPLRDDKVLPVEAARAQFLALGLDEMMTYTYLSEAQATTGTGAGAEELVTLANPLSVDTACLRPSLLPGLLRVLSLNIARDSHDLGLFEIGRVFSASGEREERQQVGVLLAGRRHPERFGAEKQQECDFYDLKGIVDSWLAARRQPAAAYRPVEYPAYETGQAAEIVLANRVVGTLGRLSDALCSDIRLKHPVFVALIELDDVLALASPPTVFRALPQFPATVRDVSLVAASDTPAGRIATAIRDLALDTIEAVELADVYDDEASLGKGKRSLTFSITYRHPERTLKDEEVNAAQEKVRSHLATAFNADLR